MNNKSCVENNHQYSLWNIDQGQNIAWRVCSKCKFRRELPITEEIQIEVQKQEEAVKIFKAFQMIDNQDENMVNYLNLIIEDYINYLDRKSLRILIAKMHELEQLDIINIQDILYNNELKTYFEIESNETNHNSLFNINEEQNDFAIDFTIEN